MNDICDALYPVIVSEENENQVRELPVLVRVIRPDDLARAFNGIADRWERETGIYSSPTKRFKHPEGPLAGFLGTVRQGNMRAILPGFLADYSGRCLGGLPDVL